MSLKEVICPVCGKSFIPAPMHVFKTPTGSYICAYSCVLERERRVKKKMEKARERRLKNAKGSA
jgi:hypothetical protein